MTTRTELKWPKHRVLPVAAAALLGPDLGGRAACAGLAPLFDERRIVETDDEYETRVHRAVAVCRGCPVQAACASARADLGSRASGVWAGISSTRRTP